MRRQGAEAFPPDSQQVRWPPLVPALVTGLRMLAAFWVGAMAYYGIEPLALFWIVLGAAATDYLDGWTARRLRRSSFEGKVLDFVADKIFLSVTLLVMARAGWVDTITAAALSGYHLLVLAATTVVSWGVGKPLVVIPTSEKLVVILSFVLAASAAGSAALPGKAVYSTIAGTAEFLALASTLFGVAGYLRLIRRLLARYGK